jgi:hypothetical protein
LVILLRSILLGAEVSVVIVGAPPVTYPRETFIEILVFRANVVDGIRGTELLYSEALPRGEKLEALHVTRAHMAWVVVLREALGAAGGPEAFCGLGCATGLSNGGT